MQPVLLAKQQVDTVVHVYQRHAARALLLIFLKSAAALVQFLVQRRKCGFVHAHAVVRYQNV